MRPKLWSPDLRAFADSATCQLCYEQLHSAHLTLLPCPAKCLPFTCSAASKSHTDQAPSPSRQIEQSCHQSLNHELCNMVLPHLSMDGAVQATKHCTSQAKHTHLQVRRDPALQVLFKLGLQSSQLLMQSPVPPLDSSQALTGFPR